MTKAINNKDTVKYGRDAALAIVEAIVAIKRMARARGETPSTALVAGYMSLMTVRMLDGLDKKLEEEE